MPFDRQRPAQIGEPVDDVGRRPARLDRRPLHPGQFEGDKAQTPVPSHLGLSTVGRIPANSARAEVVGRRCRRSDRAVDSGEVDPRSPDIGPDVPFLHPDSKRINDDLDLVQVGR